MSKEQEAYSQIYDKYIDKIYRFIFLKVNSQEKAQDLCSETFLRGWKVFKDKNKKIDNPQAFLYKIARNLIIDYYREKSRTPIVSADFDAVIDPRIDLEKDSTLKSDLNNIMSALPGIKNEYQEVIIWRYVEDLSISEIAKILDKSEGTVRVTLHRALSSLKEKIEEA